MIWGRGAGLILLAFAGTARGQLPPPVPRPPPRNCTAAEHRQLDFWVGDWDVYYTGSEGMAGRSTIERIYNDCAIRETWSPFDMNDGGSVSSYDAAAGAWRQTWIDSTAERIDYAGRFEDDRMILIAARPPRPGEDERLTRVTLWRDGDLVRQTGETSSDGGLSWAPSYDYTYRQHGTPPR